MLHRLEYQRRNSAKESKEIVVHEKDMKRRESEKNGSTPTTPLWTLNFSNSEGLIFILFFCKKLVTISNFINTVE